MCWVSVEMAAAGSWALGRGLLSSRLDEKLQALLLSHTLVYSRSSLVNSGADGRINIFQVLQLGKEENMNALNVPVNVAPGLKRAESWKLAVDFEFPRGLERIWSHGLLH